jgi:hypothetical protein
VADPTPCFYHIGISLESFLHLYKRSQLPTSTLVEAYRQAQLDDLMEVVTLLVLPIKCYQVEFELRLGNPFTRRLAKDPSDCSHCSFCQKVTEFPSVVREGLVSILFHVFLSGPHQIIGSPKVDSVVAAIVKFPNAVMLFLRSKIKKLPPSTVKKTLLMLIAARILALDLIPAANNADGETDHDIVLSLSVISPSSTQFAMHDDSYWVNIPTKL